MRHLLHVDAPTESVPGSRAPLRFALAAALLLGAPALSQASEVIPSFSATALTGRSITAADLLGKPAVLILTPSRQAASDTRKWARALRGELAHDVRVRDVLAIDLPFFMSEADALGRAKEKIPARYYDQTWLMSSQTLESALGVPPSSPNAFVFVLDARGHVMTRISGDPSAANVSQVQAALKALR